MKLKNIFKALAIAALPSWIAVGSLSSCSDMLETDSALFVSDPNINQKSDSVFYAYGIMQAMQQLADQYYFQNEMRGDISVPTDKATTHLKSLAQYSAGSECKYDSVYLYYKVINNCNTYLQKRDTTLLSGTQNVTINEFAAIASFRAWAYLQLVKQYGNVPYITTPVLTVSEINAKTEHTPYMNILADQAQYLQNLKNKYSEEFLSVPYYQKQVEVGHLNSSNSRTKTIEPSKCFIPLDIILGDIYLEMGEYEKAAVAYHDYLLYKAKNGVDALDVNYCNMAGTHDGNGLYVEVPLDYNINQNNQLTNGAANWDRIFSNNLMSGQPGDEVISYIPMAVNYTKGQTTDVPYAFGYDYYASENNSVSRYKIFGCPEHNEMQIQPSSRYMNMVKSQPYYYYTNEKDPQVISTRYMMSSTNIGDGRANMIVKGEATDSTKLYVQKPSTGFIYLYRTSTVFLHLAEALNRMGEPELSFAILKSGLNSGIKAYVDTAYVEENKIPAENYYIPIRAYQRLKEGNLDFFSDANANFFTNTTRKEIVGIHAHGAGAVEDIRSPYSYKSIVEARIKLNRVLFNGGDDGSKYTDEEYINAMEDILCDEYALEFAFEGTRFSDLERIARHKNMASTYGSNLGGRWFDYMLRGRDEIGALPSLVDENNWYLPFK